MVLGLCLMMINCYLEVLQVYLVILQMRKNWTKKGSFHNGKKPQRGDINTAWGSAPGNPSYAHVEYTLGTKVYLA
jgi:hypothetical protein